MKKRLIIGALALFLLIIPLSYAEGFSITSEPVKNKIAKNEWAAFDINITNNQSYTDVFKLNSKVEGTEWSLLTESTIDYTTGVTVNPRSSKTVRLLLNDKNLGVNPEKAYVVDLSAKSSRTEEKKTTLMKVFIVSEERIDYESDISASLNIPRYIDPRNIYSFVVNIKNNNPKEIKDLKVELESGIFTREATVELAPETQKAVEFTAEFDDDMKPVLDTLTITISEDGETLYRETRPIEIVSYRIPFKRETSMESSFLKTVKNITLTNKETVEKQQTIYVPSSLLNRIFVSSEPEAEVVEKDGRSQLAWDVKIASEKSETITVVTNYRPVFYILLLAAIVAILYFVFRDPIVILKHAESIKRTEGGISELKIILNFKNRSRKKFSKVTVIDRVPQLVEVEKKPELGTLPPKKVKQKKEGTNLRWDLEMDSHEERLIKYIIKSKLSILGNMTLPPAVIVVEDKETGKKRKIKSNEVNISEE
ncbi:MAG: hypothetical protein R6U32_06920 [Candidatus Woesearchaeota archaeon]